MQIVPLVVTVVAVFSSAPPHTYSSPPHTVYSPHNSDMPIAFAVAAVLPFSGVPSAAAPSAQSDTAPPYTSAPAPSPTSSCDAGVPSVSFPPPSVFQLSIAGTNPRVVFGLVC